MFRSTITVSLLAALGAVVSFLNQLVLAKLFGTSAEMDAYLIAVSLPLTVSALLSGVLNYQLVPALQRIETQSRGSAALVRSLVLGLGGGAAIVAIAGIIGAGKLVSILNPALPGSEQAVIVRLAHITWIYLPLSVVGSVYVAGLHIRQRFAAATLSLCAPVVGSLVVCLVAHDYLGIEAVVWGQFLGYLGMVGGLRMVYGGSGFSCDWAGLRDVGLAFPRALFSVVIFIIFPFSDAFWGSRIGPSSVSYLGYAQRLLVGFSGLAVVGLTTVVFPRLARHAAEGKGASLREDLGLSIRIMLSWIVPSATLFSLLGTASIQILFQRGSFSLVDARALGALMPVMLCGMVAMSCCGLVFKGLFASGQVGFASLLSVIGSVVYFGLSGIFGLSHGIIGIGSAYAVSWWLVFGLGMRYLWREVPWKMIVLVRWRFVVQLAFATILLVLFGWLGTFGLPSENTSNGLGRLSIIVGTWFGGVLVYLVIGNRLPALLEVQWIIAKAVSLASRQTESLMSKDRLAKHQRNET